MRVKKHPILKFKKKGIVFYFNGIQLNGKEDDMIAYALYDNGVKVLSESPKLKRSRGLYCGIGTCGSCKMSVNGIDNVITCITKVEEKMEIFVQVDKGKLNDT